MKHILRTATAGFFFLIISAPGKSQEKYKDIYPYIETRNFIEAVPRLKEYLKENPDEPSANLQLAIIYEERYKKYNPLVQYRPSLKNAENAKTYFLKAGLLVDEKEIRRNGKKYYTNFAKPDEKGKLDVSYRDVKSKIDSAYIGIDQFIRHIPDIHAYFTRAVSYYDQASRDFAEINGRYNNLKDLYLLYDESLSEKLKKIKENYDSGIFNLKKYLEATELYPIFDYKQTYSVRSIENYRLDGLQTHTDFLDTVISLWNYGEWVDNVNFTVNSDVKKINDQLTANEDMIKDNISLLSDPANALKNGAGVRHADRDLILKLRNYDHNSVIIPLLLYQDKKQDLLFRALHEYDLRRDSVHEITSGTLLAYYSQLFSMSRECDSLLKSLKEVNNNFNKSKHRSFINRYFGGDDGFDQYVAGEAKFIKDEIEGYADKINNGIIRNIKRFNDTLAYAVYKKMQIPLFIKAMDSLGLEPESPVTTLVVSSPDSSIIVSGIISPQKSNGSTDAFLAKTDKSRNVQWMTTLNSGGEDTTVVHNIAGAVAIVPEGFAVVLHSYDTMTRSAINNFILIDETGKVDTTLRLSVNDFPRKVKYDETDGSYLVVYKGKDRQNILDETEPLRWSKLNLESGELWNGSMAFTGTIDYILLTKSGYMLVGNFNSITDVSGKVISAGSSPDDTKAFGITLNDSGNVDKIKTFDASYPYYIYAVNKINDENINLIGIKGPYSGNDSTGSDENPDTSIHYIFNSNFDIFFTKE